MDDDANRITIGALARLTGLPVRTLRFYSDSGLVTPADRSDAGYRLYDAAAAGRVELVRTLRELGVDLPTIKRVLDRELSVAGVPAPTPPRSMRRSACCACSARSCRSPPRATRPRRR
jgi:DNA-binding transcriptional MerR regulator